MSDNDLKKLMAKMNDNKKPAEKPVENVPQSPANVPQPAEIPAPAEKPIEQPAPAEIPDDADEEDIEAVNDAVNKADPIEQVPARQEDDHNSIEQEVAVLQNVGIFRREMVLIEREKVDVLKVMAQTLLDIKKKLLGEEDATPK